VACKKRETYLNNKSDLMRSSNFSLQMVLVVLGIVNVCFGYMCSVCIPTGLEFMALHYDFNFLSVLGSMLLNLSCSGVCI
jgi:hypothetical protein